MYFKICCEILLHIIVRVHLHESKAKVKLTSQTKTFHTKHQRRSFGPFCFQLVWMNNFFLKDIIIPSVEIYEYLCWLLLIMKRVRYGEIYKNGHQSIITYISWTKPSHSIEICHPITLVPFQMFILYSIKRFNDWFIFCYFLFNMKMSLKWSDNGTKIECV